MKRFLLVLIGMFFLTFQQLIAQDKVALKIQKFAGDNLPETTRLIVLTKKGNTRMLTEDGALPPLSTNQAYDYDVLNENAKTKRQYLKTKSLEGSIYFVYALTPWGEIYYSSNKKGDPEYKQVVAGLIYVKKLAKTDAQWQKIFAAFNQATPFEIRDKVTKKFLPEGTVLKILTRSKDHGQDFVLPREQATASDKINGKGQSTQKYDKTALSKKRYFIYALTPDLELYFTSNSNEEPFFDVMVSGKMSLSQLVDVRNYTAILSSHFGIKDESSESEETTTTVVTTPTPVPPAVDTPIAEERETPESEEEEQEGATDSNGGILGCFILVLFPILYGLLRSRTAVKPALDFIAVGVFSTILFSFFTNAYPLLFSITGLALGSYLVFTRKENTKEAVFTLFSFVMGGFLYSFFFQGVIDDIVLKGETFEDKSSLLMFPFIAIAAGVMIHSFCMTVLTFGKDKMQTRTLTYISAVFLPFALFGAKIFYVQMAIIHYVFFVLLIFTLINFASNNKYATGLSVVKIPMAFLSILFNYLVLTSAISGILNFFFEKELVQGKRLSHSNQEISRVLGVGTFLFHLLYFSLGIALISILSNLGLSKQVAFALSLSSIGLIPLIALAFSIYTFSDNSRGQVISKSKSDERKS